MKYILQIIVGVFFIYIGNHTENKELKPEFVGYGWTLLVFVVVTEIMLDIIKNWKRIKLIIHCKLLSLTGQKIRFSMSYQYRIKLNDKYLLVKNSNYGQYQFVGGKYKRLPGSQGYLQSEFNAHDDTKLKTTGTMKDDFAIFVPAGKAIAFLDWFNSGKDREISHWREFYEELLDGKAKLLPQHIFPYVNYKYVGTITTPIQITPGWDCPEILQYDVLDLLPNIEQEKELQKLLNAGDTDYVKWADASLINTLGYDSRQQRLLYTIAPYTKSLLNMKWLKK